MWFFVSYFFDCLVLVSRHVSRNKVEFPGIVPRQSGTPGFEFATQLRYVIDSFNVTTTPAVFGPFFRGSISAPPPLWAVIEVTIPDIWSVHDLGTPPPTCPGPRHQRQPAANHWAKLYVYKRLKFLNSKSLSAFLTVTPGPLAASRHGIRSGGRARPF